jgi:general secretion pathway protein E
MSVIDAPRAIEVLASADPSGAVAPDADAPSAVSGHPSPEFLRLIPHDYARRHLILSEGWHAGVEHLRVAERSKAAAIFNVGVRLGREVVTTIAAAESVASAIDAAYARTAEGTSASSANPPGLEVTMQSIEGSANVEADLAAAVRDVEQDLLNLDGKSPSIRLVDLILFEALQRDASDVHIQPVRDRTLVRYRLDGALHTVRELPGSLAAAVVSRIKVMARLDVAEHRAPQDGRAAVSIGGSSADSDGRARRIDLRVSTLPSTYGERVVLRLLDPARSAYLLNFSTLGMPKALEATYLAQVSRTTGIVLSTGPTGSGKTTTLYTTLSWLSESNSSGGVQASSSKTAAGHAAPASQRGCELNMMTIEDPVEYDLTDARLAVSQTQVDIKKNVTFAAGLRHILRQDPDVIMVGEVRDEETARIAVQASLTGHLVLSTLHTSDAPGAVARLIDLSVEPFLVASSLAAVLAQRLVRRVHPACQGAGCPECHDTGYKGRVGVFELLVLDSELRELVGRRASAVAIQERARGKGMRTLREAGAELVARRITTPQEVARVIEALDELEGPA